MEGKVNVIYWYADVGGEVVKLANASTSIGCQQTSDRRFEVVDHGRGVYDLVFNFQVDTSPFAGEALRVFR